MRDRLARLLGRPRACRESYSQCGEDAIAAFVLESLGIARPTYLDLGAHDPVYLSNTYALYRRGCRGVLVEPDPELYARLRRKRPGDLCLNAGVGSSPGPDRADFFVMTTRTLNTFSRAEAERYQSYGNQRIERVVPVPLLPPDRILADHFSPWPNFVSLDVEGFEVAILRSIDFGRFRPEVVCVETLTYTEDRSEEKVPAVAELMRERGYMVYADTYINTLFVDEAPWRKRP